MHHWVAELKTYTVCWVGIYENTHTQCLNVPPQFASNRWHAWFLRANIADRFFDLVLEEYYKERPEDNGDEGEEAVQCDIRICTTKPYIDGYG